MKKLLLLMCIAISLVACEGPEGPVGPQGEPGYGTKWAVEFFEVYAEDWTEFYDPSSNDTYFACELVPEIYKKSNEEKRNYIYNDGNVFVYRITDYNGPNETQTLLPFVYNWQGNDFSTMLETTYYEYTPNKISLYTVFSGEDKILEPLDYQVFRVVMNW